MAFQTNYIQIDGSINVDGSIFQNNTLFEGGDNYWDRTGSTLSPAISTDHIQLGAAANLQLGGATNTYITGSFGGNISYYIGGSAIQNMTSSNIVMYKPLSTNITDTVDIGTNSSYFRDIYAQKWYIDDTSTSISNIAGDLTFTDINAGAKTLSELASGGGSGDVQWSGGNVGSNNQVLTATGDGSIVAESNVEIDSGGMIIKEGKDFNFYAPTDSSDCGDIVFRRDDGSAELARLWTEANSGRLFFRREEDGLTTRLVYTAENLFSSGNTDNRLITASGNNDGALVGESNMTFNGSLLSVTGDVKASSQFITKLSSYGSTDGQYLGEIDTGTGGNYENYMAFFDSSDTVGFSISNGATGAGFFPIFNGKVTASNPALYFVGNSVNGPNSGTPIIGFDARVNNAAASASDILFEFGSGYGNSRMVIMGDGKVGIADDTPSYTLDVNGDIGLTGNLYPSSSFIVYNETRISDDGYIFRMRNTSGNADDRILSFYQASSSSIWRIISSDDSWNYEDDIMSFDVANDRVGIFDSAPSYTLDVNGTGRFTGDLTVADLNVADEIFVSGGSPRINITDTDTGADSMIQGSSSVGGLLISADMNNEVAGSYLRLAVDGSIILTVDDLGYVGINNTSPSYTLDVDGTGRFTSTLTTTHVYPSSNGTYDVGAGTSSNYFRSGYFSGTVYADDGIQINWENIAYNITPDTAGNGFVKSSVGLMCNTYFGSSDNAAVLGTSSAGVAYIRPTSYNSASDQFTVDQNGTSKQYEGAAIGAEINAQDFVYSGSTQETLSHGFIVRNLSYQSDDYQGLYYNGTTGTTYGGLFHRQGTSYSDLRMEYNYLEWRNGTTGGTNELMFRVDSTDCALYYNGSQKLITQSGGIDVTGSVTCDGATVAGSISMSGSADITGIDELAHTSNATGVKSNWENASTELYSEYYDDGPNTWELRNGVATGTGGTVVFQVDFDTGLCRSADDIVAYYSFSDERLKTNINNIGNISHKLKKIEPITFNWKDGAVDNRTHFGFIAQQVEPYFPETVTEDLNVREGKEFKRIRYDEFAPILTKAFQEQQEKIESQDKTIKSLEDRIDKLEKLIKEKI